METPPPIPRIKKKDYSSFYLQAILAMLLGIFFLGCYSVVHVYKVKSKMEIMYKYLPERSKVNILIDKECNQSIYKITFREEYRNVGYSNLPLNLAERGYECKNKRFIFRVMDNGISHFIVYQNSKEIYRIKDMKGYSDNLLLKLNKLWNKRYHYISENIN